MERRTGCERPNDGVRAREEGSVLASTGAGGGAVTLWDTTAATCLGAMFGGASVASANPNLGVVVSARRVLFPGRSTARDVRLPRVGARVGRGESREDFLVARAQRRRRRRLRVQSGWRVGRHSLRRRNRAAVGSERRTRARVPRRRKRVQLLGGGVRAHRRASRRRHRNPAGGALTLRGYNVGVLWEGKYGA